MKDICFYRILLVSTKHQHTHTHKRNESGKTNLWWQKSNGGVGLRLKVTFCNDENVLYPVWGVVIWVYITVKTNVNEH